MSMKRTKQRNAGSGRQTDDEPNAWSDTLARVAPLLERGCVPQVAARPLIVEFHLRNPFLFASMNSMKPVFGDQPVETQKQFYASAEFRSSFGEVFGERRGNSYALA